MFILNDKPLPIDTPFTVDGTQYPANWLRLSSAKERKALGITEVADQPRPDDRYYWVTQNADGTFTSEPKELSNLKNNAIDLCNEAVWQTLNKTDFMDSRKANDPAYTPPAEWVEWRASVRTAAGAYKSAIMATKTVEELIAVGAPAFPLPPSGE